MFQGVFGIQRGINIEGLQVQPSSMSLSPSCQTRMLIDPFQVY